MNKSNKLSDAQKVQLVKLYEEGKMDSEIAKILGNVTRAAVMYWRKKLNLPTRFSYSKISKIDSKRCIELFNAGFSDYKIAKELHVSPDGVWYHRSRLGLVRNCSLAESKMHEFSTVQKEILMGTLLGDASLRVGKWCKNPNFVCTHGLKQKEYCEYKTSLFSSHKAQCRHHKRKTIDMRTGIYYEDYTMFLGANPALLPLYNAFYVNGKKHIPIALFDMITARSLAFWYMDDGCKVRDIGYAIATQSFERDELQAMQAFLKQKFNLNTSLWRDNVLYIKHDSMHLFESLILPYMCDSMKYKISVSLNSVNLGKPSDTMATLNQAI